VDDHRVQETFRQAPGGAADAVPALVSADGGVAPGGDDEALARLTSALRAGLPGSGQQGPDLLSGQMPADADPFEFYGSGAGQADSATEPLTEVSWLNLSASAGAIERRVALMAQDMAAFGGAGREAPLRLDAPAEALRHEYFA
jgi:hypothetical protein